MSKHFKIARAIPFAGALICSAGSLFAQADDSELKPETFGEKKLLDWPELVFSEAGAIDTMYNVIFYLTTATFIVVAGLMVYFMIKYRHKPGRRAVFIHGNNKLEMTWTLVPTIILAVIAAIRQDTWSKMKTPAPAGEGEAVLKVNIIAEQFKWNFHYPGADGEFGEIMKTELIKTKDESEGIEDLMGLDRSGAGKDDVISAIMVVPVNTRIDCEMTSVDVIHSFFLPNFRVKQDVLPFTKGNIWFRANRTGGEVIGQNPGQPLRITDADANYVNITDDKPFDIICAELCGSGHFTMKGQLYVLDQSSFERWRDIRYAAEAAEDEGDEY